MGEAARIGIVICDRYRSCAGGKCLRALHGRQGAFSAYAETDLELVGYTTCGGCPGGNIEHAVQEMLANHVEVIHLATGMIVGFPPCPHIEAFKAFLEQTCSLKVVIGTHPIPRKYLAAHTALRTWEDAKWEALLKPTMADEATRKAYD
jgi:predicted metal-binding protein